MKHVERGKLHCRGVLCFHYRVSLPILITRCFQYFVQKVGDPVETRLSEANKRPAAFDELGKSIQQIRKILELCAQKVKFSEENNDLGI